MALRSPGSRPVVFMYHSVSVQETDPFRITVNPELFHTQLSWLASRGIRGVALRELVTAHRRDDLVGLTFDDGYRDFLTTAIPILQEFGFTATTFAVLNRIGMTNDWDSGGPVIPLMSEAELRQCVSEGMEVGSHALEHRSLPTLHLDDLRKSVGVSKERLEGLVGHQVVTFAYPYGHAGPREIDAVTAAGYSAACLATPKGSGRRALGRAYAGNQDNATRLRLKIYRQRLAA